LLEREPDGDVVLLVTLEAQVPAVRRRTVGDLLALGRDQRAVGGQLAGGPGVDGGDGQRHLLLFGEVDERHGSEGDGGRAA